MANPIHEDDDLDEILGNLVARGAEINSELSTKFIWVTCRCEQSEHVVAVPLRIDQIQQKQGTILKLQGMSCVIGRSV